MNIPGFTADASLYRTMGHYRCSVSECGDALSGESIIPAYYPGPETRSDCQTCQETCALGVFGCLGEGALLCGSFCGFATIFYGFCFAGCMGIKTAICIGLEALCHAGCGLFVCCPKSCGVPNPLTGEGCCDENEQCVDRYDPNSRDGCCPSDQIVCGGKCCAKGYSCCGETCCPAGYFCRDGWFCEREFMGSFPTTPPPPPVNNCILGGAPCGSKCCPPGLACCGVFYGQPECRTSCTR